MAARSANDAISLSLSLAVLPLDAIARTLPLGWSHGLDQPSHRLGHRVSRLRGAGPDRRRQPRHRRQRRQLADSAGRISYGSDMVVRTPRIKPRRVRDHITTYWAQHAPYGYVLEGRLVLPHGLSKPVACATGGAATVTITRAGHTIAQRRLKLTAHCTYHTALSFTAAQLPGSGTLKFQMRFGGNRRLQGRPARTLNVVYGPRNVTR